MTITGLHAHDERAESAGDDSPAPLPHESVDFAHNSERQFAKLLDFYEIEWDYEPTTFDIDWDRQGNATQRFSPDFYLPAFDLYIEITTLNQKLVTKKNRKARRLMTLYPDVKCKILYQKDYLNLLIKYGLEEPSQGALLTPVDAAPSEDPPFLGPALAG
ncbi:MAG TPA: hypothetical protein VEU29_02285 [Actinomycetota bacterium]|nr:hypothetical protein [Actinomycetota bacterium]